MAIIIIGGTKGGTGKSTLSVNMAAWLALLGRNVLLVDTDPQGSASVWCHMRANAGITPIIPLAILDGELVGEQIRQLAANFEDVVIDVAGYNSVELHSALEVADVLLTPACSGFFDYHSLTMLDPMIGDLRHKENPNLRALLVLNRMSTNSRATDAAKMRASVKPLTAFKILDPMTRNRSAFSDVIPEGKGVMEGRPRNKKAIAEFNAIAQEVINHAK